MMRNRSSTTTFNQPDLIKTPESIIAIKNIKVRTEDGYVMVFYSLYASSNYVRSYKGNGGNGQTVIGA